MSRFDELQPAMDNAMNFGFGDKIIYSQTDQTPVQISAIYTPSYETVKLIDDIEVPSYSPAYDIKLADLSFRPKKHDRITALSGKIFEVHTIEAIGQGRVMLITFEV